MLAAILLCSLIVVAFGCVFLRLRAAWVLAVPLIAAILAMTAALRLLDEC